MAQNQGMGLPQELHEQIVQASCILLNNVQDVLRPSSTPGRYHYQFNLKDLTRVFQVRYRYQFSIQVMLPGYSRYDITISLTFK